MATRTPKADSGSTSPSRSRRTAAASRPHEELFVSGGHVAGGARAGAGFGRCGGRPIVHRIEREICDRLTNLGVAHSHRPRHFEVRIDDAGLAAYAPTMVLRGRGREGKTVVVETAERATDESLPKIKAFRKQYGLEFYVCFVAPEDVLDTVHFDTYDEAATTTDVHTLVSRLAD